MTPGHATLENSSLLEQEKRNQTLCPSSAAGWSQLNWMARLSHGSGCTPDWKRNAPCKPTPVLAARVASAPVAPATVADSLMELRPGRVGPERSCRRMRPDS